MMRNPGCMLISVADFYAGSRSVCRNPILQKLFMLLGNGEKAGSGADIITKGWEDNKWSAPVLSERVQPDEIEIHLPINLSDAFPQEDAEDIQELREFGISDVRKEPTDKNFRMIH